MLNMSFNRKMYEIQRKKRKLEKWKKKFDEEKY